MLKSMVMELSLSWDLVFGGLIALCFLALVFCSHRFTLRLILGSYLALILSEAGALFFENILVPVIPDFQNWVAENGLMFYMGLRVAVFLIILLLFVARGHYHVGHKSHDKWIMRAILHIIFALMSSLLLVVSIFVFLSGESVIDALLGTFAPIDWFDTSYYVPMAVEYYGVWLLLPAVGMLLNSIFGGRSE